MAGMVTTGHRGRIGTRDSETSGNSARTLGPLRVVTFTQTPKCKGIVHLGMGSLDQNTMGFGTSMMGRAGVTKWEAALCMVGEHHVEVTVRGSLIEMDGGRMFGHNVTIAAKQIGVRPQTAVQVSIQGGHRVGSSIQGGRQSDKGGWTGTSREQSKG